MDLLRRIGRGLIAPLVAAAAAIVISSVALLISGNSPVEAFTEMWMTIDSVESLVLIVNRAVPYYIAGVAVGIGFKMNLFNIGANGQYVLAALIAAWVGAEVDLWAPLHVTFILVVAIAVGMFWAAIAAVLKVTRNVNEVIATIMLNFIATGIVAFLLSEVARDEENGGLVAQTKLLPASAQIPSWTIGGTELFGFLPIAIAIGIGYHVLLNRSRFGYELRLSGTNPAAARSAGVNPNAMVIKTMLLSGAVAGLIGMQALLADPQFHKFGDQFPKTIGFTGISLALLGRNSPIGIAAAAFVWATIERATQALSPAGIPQEIGVILQGSFLLSAVIAYEVVTRRNNAAAAAAAARALHAGAPPSAPPSSPPPGEPRPSGLPA
jgi:general nucleoside transport system permease protein